MATFTHDNIQSEPVLQMFLSKNGLIEMSGINIIVAIYLHLYISYQCWIHDIFWSIFELLLFKVKQS